MVSRVLLISLLLLSVVGLIGQIPITTLGTPYNQNFDVLAPSGTNNPWTNHSTIPGWHLFRQPAPGTALTSYNSSDGSSTTGSMYSFGSTSSSERALGALASGGTYWGSPSAGSVAGWIAVAFLNSTGTTISQMQITYDGEQWRDANTTPQSLIVEYGIGASFTTVATWTLAGAPFNFNSPVNSNSGAINGNTVGKVAGIGGLIGGLTWNPGQLMWIRWRVTNAVGNDHGLGIDNFQFIAYSPDYAITVSGGSMTVTDLKGNSDVLTVSEPSAGNIGFNAPGRTYSLNGGPALPFPVSLTLTGITNLTINAEDGDDVVDVQGFTVPFPWLTVNGGNGDDDVKFSGDINFAPSASLDVILVDDTPTPGIDNVFFLSGAELKMQDANAYIDVSRSVAFSPGSSLEITDGTIIIYANYSVFPSTTGNFVGINLNNASIKTNGLPSFVTLIGRGGDDPGGQHGVALYNDSEIIAENGDVYITGYGGNAPGSANMGVTLEGGSTVSGDNRVEIYGYGGGQGTSDFCCGIHTFQSPSIISNAGSIVLYGYGALDPNGAQNHGVLLRDFTNVSAQDFCSIVGYGGGTSISDFNTGIMVESDAQVNADYIYFSGTGGSSDGNANIGTLMRLNAEANATDFFSSFSLGGTGAGIDNIGFWGLDAQINVSNGGAFLSGTGGDGLDRNQGVRLSFGFNMTTAGLTSVGGIGGSNPLGTDGYGVFLEDNGTSIVSSDNIYVYGTEGAGSDNYGIVMQNASSISSLGTSNIWMYANSMDLNAPASISAGGAVFLVNGTFLVPIDVGSTTDFLGGPLSLSDAELDLVSAPIIHIGDQFFTGDISITAPISITIPSVQVLLNSNRDILFPPTGGTFDVGLTGSLFLNGGFTPFQGVYPDKDNVDVRCAPSTLTLSSFTSLNIIINGTTPGDGTGSTYTQLNVEGAINLNNATLQLSGSYVPTGGEVFIVGVNDGTDAVSGTFAGLSEGATIFNILGSGLNATITYVGNTGNDVVIIVQGSSCPPPTFTTCPSNIVVPNTSGQCGAVVNYTAVATGTPAPTLTYTFSGATTGSGSGTGSGSFFNVGTTNVVITASNGCPPNAVCSFQVTVNDTQAPTITCPPTQTLVLGTNCQATLPAYAPTSVSDNCIVSPGVTQSPV
ncbi:MAG: hypothetical protein NZM41_03735, partial [Saprospiraceae bacterium]|nr:hypothetical protein [Saprospiraceae bacterium]